MKIFNEEKSLGIDRAAGPAVRGERIVSPRVMNNLVDGGDEFGAANGRLKGRHKHTVIAARLASSNGTRSIAADTIGNEPFARFCRVQIAADLTAKLNFRLIRHRALLSFASSRLATLDEMSRLAVPTWIADFSC